MPKKLANEVPLTLRRMPIVIIPRKRKYKNYVSRRRNTQLLASLRKCVSDPHLYRSFNHWKELWRGFSPNDRVTSPPSLRNVPRLVDEGDPPQVVAPHPAPPAALPTPPQSASNKKPAFARQEFKKNETNRSAVRPGLPVAKKEAKNEFLPSNFSQWEKSSKAPAANRFGGSTQKVQAAKAQAAPSKAAAAAVESNNVSPADVENVMKQSLFNAVSELKNLIPDQLQKSAAPSPASFPKATPEYAELLPTSAGNAPRAAKGAAADLPPTDEKNPAAVPSVPKALRKAYGSKSGTTICAVGSPLNVPSTSNAGVEDQRIIEKKLSLRKRREQIKENIAFPMPAECAVDIGEKSNQADEQKAKKTVNAVAAAFSTQSISVDEAAKPEESKEVEKGIPQRTAKVPTSAAVNLLAQLQLPPTVSAKVDKIIASGQKSRVQKLGDQVDSFTTFYI
ncbi:hypothetical protein ANCCEY_09665 [Ancylostoma ceylanicum]|uniref:Uncharacterized protein n=2 Tax=Ancylostoma ceylanicum TaxID=53326 RepID=A0A0D6LGX2_9BILA|nr:hypothetical protein ANCCEY_09665 [Ancylostoma ceylanicum]